MTRGGTGNIRHWPTTRRARNVRAAGHCRLLVHERTYELDEPRVITAGERHDLPERLRAWAEARGNRYFALNVLAERDGLLAVDAGGPAMADAWPAEAVAPEADYGAEAAPGP
jgi:hypothetical protein